MKKKRGSFYKTLYKINNDDHFGQYKCYQNVFTLRSIGLYKIYNIESLPDFDSRTGDYQSIQGIRTINRFKRIKLGRL